MESCLASRLALVALFVAAQVTHAGAQAQFSALETLLRPGMTVWITDAGGAEARHRVLELAGDVLVTTRNDRTERLRTADVTRVRTRQSDSIVNGALIGAGAAIAAGLFMCTTMEPWENCRDEVGPIASIGAIGAGIGIGVDALIRPRRTIYEAPPRSAGIRVVPIIVPRASGLRVSISY